MVAVVLIAAACAGSSQGGQSAAIGERGTDDAGADSLTTSELDQGSGFQVAAAMPTSADDRGFSQTLVDGLQAMRSQGLIDNIILSSDVVLDEDAALLFRQWADDGIDLIIGHGPQYGGLIAQVATEHPEIAFAWGYGDDTFGLANVTVYDAAAAEGGYVMGHVAAAVIGEGSIALIGPSQVGDDHAFIDGFVTGIAASGAEMDITEAYVESYVDIDAAADRARGSVLNEADVFVSTSGISPGVIGVSAANDIPYFGNHVDNSDLASDDVVASQVYRWEVLLTDVVSEIKAGDLGGERRVLTLGNGGLEIRYNPDFALSAEAVGIGELQSQRVMAGEVEPSEGT